MKKYLHIITLNVLLIITPTIIAMEKIQNSNDSKNKLSEKIQKFCNLFSSPEDILVLSITTSSHQEILNELENSIKNTDDCFKLRNGMFLAMEILMDTPREKKEARKELKILCKVINNHLTTLLDNNPQKAKNFCCNVLDCLSDSEDEKIIESLSLLENENSDNYENQALKNFNKYKLIQNLLYKNNQNKTELEEILQQDNSLIKGKLLEIITLEEQLKQAKEEYDDLNEKNIAYQNEIKAICAACNLLNKKGSNELLTIKTQKEELEKTAQETKNYIDQLQNQLNATKFTTDDATLITRSNILIDLGNAHKKSMKIKTKISYVTRYLDEANKKISSLENITSYLDPYKLKNYLSSMLWSK